MARAHEHAQNSAKNSAGTSKKRGSVNNADRLSIFSESRGGGEADWGGCDPKWVMAVITKITALGGAVTFGLSRDQGAHSLTLLLDQNRQTLWYNQDADLDTELEGVVATLDTL